MKKIIVWLLILCIVLVCSVYLIKTNWKNVINLNDITHPVGRANSGDAHEHTGY